MLNWVLSLMVHKELMSLNEAEYVAKELVIKTHPQNFLDAHKIVENILKDYEKK